MFLNTALYIHSQSCILVDLFTNISNSIPTSYTNTNPHHTVSTCFSHAVYSHSPLRLVWDTLLSSASIPCCPKSSAGLPFILNKHTTPRQSSVARHFIQTHTSTTHQSHISHINFTCILCPHTSTIYSPYTLHLHEHQTPPGNPLDIPQETQSTA